MYELLSSPSSEVPAEPPHPYCMDSDYHGLKKYISMVKTQQENDDRRYRSSLYSGAPGRTHVLRFPTIGKPSFPFLQRQSTHERTAGAVERPTRGSLFRPSPRYSLTLPRGIGQPHTDIKGAHGVGKRQPVRSELTHQPQNRSTTLLPSTGP